jgi:hypothetical protein
VTVLPADSDLEDEMEIIEPDRDRHLDVPQDRRLDVIERDLEAGDVGHGEALQWNNEVWDVE